VAVTSKPELAEQLGFLQNAIGSIPSAFEASRDARPEALALRMERHCENALAIAHWLSASEDREGLLSRAREPSAAGTREAADGRGAAWSRRS